MDDEIIIPRRPDNDADFKLTKAEKDMLVVKYLLGYSNQAAFALFNPQYTGVGGKLNKAGATMCRQFFTHPKNIEWLESYIAKLNQFMHGESCEKETTTSVTDISDERLDNAFKMYLRQMIQDIEDGKDLDSDMKKMAMELFKKLGRFKEDQEVEMRPIRVLVERCSQCRYRIGMETLVLNNEMLDMCTYCKCRKMAENQGFSFDDGKTLLDIPEDILKELEKKNDVKLEDIISGKIDN